MFRRLIPLAVAVALVVGDKKASSAPTPEATYTIKFREEKQGDKTEESETVTGTSETKLGELMKKARKDEKYVYTQEIVEMTAGETPQKLIRKYTVAQMFDEKTNALKATPLEGKTVTIMKKDTIGKNDNSEREKYYDFTIDGKRAGVDLGSEFSKARANKKSNKDPFNELLSKNAVKVGESWNIDPTSLKSFTGDGGLPIEAAKSKATCKLAKVYTKDNQQWGVIELDIDLTFNAPEERGVPAENGTMKAKGTLEMVIDGSARDGTMKLNIKGSSTAKKDNGGFTVSTVSVEEKTIKTLK